MQRFLLDFISDRRMHGESTQILRTQSCGLNVQPVVDLASGRIVSAEALIRWNHLERGLQPPSEFVPFAHEPGFLPTIGSWFVGEAVAAAAGLRAIDPAFRVWFNLSGPELSDPDWLDHVMSYGDALHGLGVEITENLAMRDLPTTRRALGVLKECGLAIALDDFCTGYSTLAQLRRLPIDFVKLNRTFVAGLPGDARDREIVSAVLAIGRKCGFEIVAEGIETGEQARELRDAGCRLGQGYYLGRAMPVIELLELVNARMSVAS